MKFQETKSHSVDVEMRRSFGQLWDEQGHYIIQYTDKEINPRMSATLSLVQKAMQKTNSSDNIVNVEMIELYLKISELTYKR